MCCVEQIDGTTAVSDQSRFEAQALQQFHLYTVREGEEREVRREGGRGIIEYTSLCLVHIAVKL